MRLALRDVHCHNRPADFYSQPCMRDGVSRVLAYQLQNNLSFWFVFSKSAATMAETVADSSMRIFLPSRSACASELGGLYMSSSCIQLILLCIMAVPLTQIHNMCLDLFSTVVF